MVRSAGIRRSSGRALRCVSSGAVLVPEKKAKRWWLQQSFVPIPELGKLRRHASHHCHVARPKSQRRTAAVATRS